MAVTIPRIYIRDNYDQVLLALDEGDYYDDRMTRFLAGKATVLQLSIHKQATDYDMIKTGTKLSFVDQDTQEEFWLNVSDVSQDERDMTIIATSLNLELNNESAGPYKSAKAMSFEEYFNVINFEKSLTLNINEVSDKKILLEWGRQPEKTRAPFFVGHKI
jgi:hypothetical protein